MGEPTMNYAIAPAVVLSLAGLLVGCHTLAPLGGTKLAGHGKTGSSAVEANRQASDLSPDKAAQACIATAEQFAQAGHQREAIALLLRARANDPEVPVSHRLAVLYDRVGEHAKAKLEYKKALQADPDDAELLNDYGFYHLSRNNLDEAERLLRRAVDEDDKNQRATINLARVLAARGKHKESYQLFSQVVGPAAAHSNLGVILARQGNQQAAQEAFEKSLELDASLQQPRAFLAYWEQSPHVPNPPHSNGRTLPASFRNR